MSTAKEVPVVDMRWDIDRFASAFGGALERFGFVSVVGHGIPSSLLDLSYRAAERLFALPLSVKQKYEYPDAGRQRGYSSFGVEHAKDDPRPDLKEFWHVGRDGSDPPNVILAEDPSVQRAFLSLYERLDGLSLVLLAALEEYLGLESGHFRDMVTGGNTLMRILHYPELAPGVEGMRSAPHEDINLITLLVSATKPGLEIKTREGEWIPVNNPPDAIIVNAGDMLQLHTLWRIPSTTHRVVNPPGADGGRYSIPFFVHPRSEVPLVTAGQYLTHRLREIGVL